ncbi:MAG TPA: hypothetical protein ENH10_04900 [Bacteroidetes bacterium]|nr:hypothetical protein [Bacteroidota bacterium]HEX04480.1 hypothetical protein [Bacteroidota bacterium]
MNYRYYHPKNSRFPTLGGQSSRAVICHDKLQQPIGIAGVDGNIGALGLGVLQGIVDQPSSPDEVYRNSGINYHPGLHYVSSGLLCCFFLDLRSAEQEEVEEL